MYHLSILALDIARERGLEADRHRRAVLAHQDTRRHRLHRPHDHGPRFRGREPRVRGRRPPTSTQCVADDLQRGLAAAE